jgi:hypothetical protein
MSKEELTQALEQQDWDSVLKQGAPLCGCGNCELRDASRLAVDTALFVLEHPEVDGVSSRLAQVVLDRLP